MSEKRWKRCEREIASLIGGRRVPITGRRGADIAHSAFAAEVKSHESLPKWLREAVSQAKAAASAGQLPIVVLHEVGDRHVEDLVVIELGAFCEWFGNVGVTE